MVILSFLFSGASQWTDRSTRYCSLKRAVSGQEPENDSEETGFMERGFLLDVRAIHRKVDIKKSMSARKKINLNG
jgi:hypothetical protein